MNEIFLKNYVRINEDKGFFGIEGGFGGEKKSMLASDIALMHNKETKRINEAIRNNIDKFVKGKDFIDVKNNSNFLDELIDHEILNVNSINRSSNIFILSERGYLKIIKILEDDISWKIYDSIMDEYFDNRKVIKEISSNNMLDIQNKMDNFLLEQEQFKQEVKGQIQELQSYYKPTHKHKISIANHIKKRLNDDQYLFDLAKERIFLSLGIDKWQDIDQKTLNDSWGLIDSTIEVLKREKEITLFNFKDKGC